MSRAKQKGTAWESALVNYLHARNLSARRKVLTGSLDQGDIDTGRWTLEAKHCQAITLAAWVDEADTEAINSGRPVVVVAKRRGKGNPGEAYVVMPLRVFADQVLTPEAATRRQNEGE